MHNLSGAVNVFLLLTVRPQLLLLIRPDPDELGVPEIELAPQNRQCNSPRNRNIPTQSNAEYDCAWKRLWLWKQRGRVTCQLES